MENGRILFVSQEITPFTPESENALMGRHLPAFIQEHGREIRVFMPRFSYVSERRKQLHEVIRLSGMNLIVNNFDHQMIIKVGSISAVRMQVYFIDNEEYFSKGGPLTDESGALTPGCDERLLFFSHSTLEAVRKLAWQPHLIHFSGWFTSMIPFYLRRINKENAFFSGTKTVLSLTADSFKGRFGEELEHKMKSDGATAKDLRIFHDLDYTNLMKAVILYAHGVVIASPNADPELVRFAMENKKNVLPYNDDQQVFYEQINRFYDSIIGSNINN